MFRTTLFVNLTNFTHIVDDKFPLRCRLDRTLHRVISWKWFKNNLRTWFVFKASQDTVIFLHFHCRKQICYWKCMIRTQVIWTMRAQVIWTNSLLITLHLLTIRETLGIISPVLEVEVTVWLEQDKMILQGNVLE